ncbi:MAG: ankyrin repeat domain-containing protein, partial [Gammaproteobacteria bacterium]|nr:ankyrin repeat domain-containing protein [Gammaproteobacteria bacterium]
MTSIDEGIAAARSGDMAKLQAWLDAGNGPDHYDTAGWTPLLWASARGHGGAVELLLKRGADISMPHRDSAALPIHLAGQSGDVRTSELLLEQRPTHINAVWDLNGHTISLQAVFYGHLALMKRLLAMHPDLSITTARGLGAMDLATQFQNAAMMDILRPHDVSAEAKAAYYRSFLKRIAPAIPPGEEKAQQLADKLVGVIGDGIRNAATDPSAVQATLDAVREIVEKEHANVNRLGGALQQPPLIVVVTGNNGFPPNPVVASLRNQLANYLLEKGADPTLHEQHPMGAQTIIRASVFNHLDILKMCAQYITPQQLTDAINEIPLVNGLTAMHDAVLRATMAAPERFEGYLDQVRWFVAHGGRSDMEDYAGVTQRDIAEKTDKPEVRR